MISLTRLIYNHAEDAVKHLYLFTDDDSNLYRNISVLDESTSTVIAYIHFDRDGKADSMLNNGDTVKTKPEWNSPGKEKYIYKVFNINEDLDRCDIHCLNSMLSLGSIETVDTNMITESYVKG